MTEIPDEPVVDETPDPAEPITLPTVRILPFDPMNTIRAAGPAQLTVEVDTAPNGQRFVYLCIRTGMTSTYVPLSRDDAMKWGAEIKRVAGQISPIMVAPAGSVPLHLPNGRKP